MLASLLYPVLRRVLIFVAPNHRSDDAAQIEILVLRYQLGILRWQVNRPVYRRRDRAPLAAASGILPREHCPEWHQNVVRLPRLRNEAVTTICQTLKEVLPTAEFGQLLPPSAVVGYGHEPT